MVTMGRIGVCVSLRHGISKSYEALTYTAARPSLIASEWSLSGVVDSALRVVTCHLPATT